MQSKENEQEAPQDNIERLRSYLTEDSLAEKLVSALIRAGEAETQGALRKVVLDRLEELRRHYELPDRQA